jgi:hypothetical protein
MHLPTVCDRLFSHLARGRRPRRRLALSVRPLEGRQLLSSAPSLGLNPSATMTQTVTFPNLESLPNVGTQALLYFSSTMGTLNEVDLVTSGSFSTEFHAENLGPSSTTIAGTTSGNLAINVPTGAIPVTVPSVTETFNASPFDGDLDDAGTSGQDFAPVTSSSAAETTVLTSPADLAAFTGNFRIPISVSGHATGSMSSGNDDVSDGFNTQTSATITVIYHYIPNLPSLNPPPTNTNTSLPSPVVGAGSSGSAALSSNSPTNVVPAAVTDSNAGAVSLVTTPPIKSTQSSIHGKKKVAKHAATSSHHVAPAVVSHPRPKQHLASRAVKEALLHKT